jgi:sialate O-acetylesterase
MRRRSLVAPLAFVLAVMAPSAKADVRLPAVVGSHMVLQQQSDVAIWGFAAAGEAVTVSASWAKEAWKTAAGADGRFKVVVRTPAAGGPYAIEVAGRNSVRLEDVLIGEVWLCGGQSNMEMAFSWGTVLDGEKERAAANDPDIRLFDAPNRLSAAPEDDCSGTWAACTPESVNTFSCIGYFFARELRRELNVPVGLIGVNWGGTPAEAWVSEQGLAPFPQFKPALAAVAAARAKTAAAEPFAAQMAKWWAALDEGDLGTKNGWAAAAFDDAGWETAAVPGEWSGPLQNFDGIGWYRRAIELPADLAGQELQVDLGPIDDMDQLYLDGAKVGATETPEHWNDARHYKIDAAKATAGRHVLAIRVVDTGGKGGILGKPEEQRIAGADGGAPLSLAGEWKFRVGLDAKRFPPLPGLQPALNPNVPSVLFNGLVNPVVPFGIRGSLWYQGESNRGGAAEYAELMPALIADWRARFGRPNFPFFFVQIAPFDYDRTRTATAELRQAQVETLRVHDTGMVVTMDIGDPKDIHPKNKQEVGRRLSLWALAKCYGRTNLEFSGPLFESMRVDGNAIRVRFTHCAGLTSKGGPPKLFEVAGADGKFYEAAAAVDGETVVASSPQVKEPKEARFAFTDSGAVNLFNGAGLPASPFCKIARPAN